MGEKTSPQNLEHIKNLHQQGDIKTAISLYRDFLKQHSHSDQAHFLLGTALIQSRQESDAILHLQKSLDLQKDNKAAWFNLGLAFQKTANPSKAAQAFDQALQLDPHYTEALCQKGILLSTTQNHEQALEYFHKALQAQPKHLKTWTNLGNCFRSLGEDRKAHAAYTNALEIAPRHIPALHNLAALELDLGNLEAATKLIDTVLQINPNYTPALCQKALVYKEQEQWLKALAEFEQAERLTPNDKRVSFHKALVLFKLNLFKEAQQAYEARLSLPEYKHLQHLSQTLWTGEPLNKKALLLLSEQGVGDEIFFAQTFSKLQQEVDFLIIEADARLKTLFERSFPGTEVVPTNRPIPEPSQDDTIDFYASSATALGPLFFEPKHEALPSYLKACTKKQNKWRQKLSSLSDKKHFIGINWRSFAKSEGLDRSVRNRSSIPLLSWQNILALKDICFVDLQYGDTSKERADFTQRTGLDLLHLENINLKDDLDELAALIASLDLVISINSCNAILSAALGKETWMLCHRVHGHDFEPAPNNQNKTASKWFQSLTLFHQEQVNSWSETLERINVELKNKSF
ncbi:MAG: tetratricopeptide repeat protein [Deltaproteobacteria bacterium]|nr:tetratricopeptide repeat protein [Deltaproteobacteria bacterium]